MVKINGEQKDVAGLSEKEYLVGANYSLFRVAVELNGEILKKNEFESVVFKDGDVAEIVNFVGGG